MRKILPKIVIFSSLFTVFFVAQTNQSGPGSGYTNAPSESNCATSGCHSSSSLITSGSNWNNLTLSNNFTGGGYIPDSVYTLVLAYKETGMKKSGFQITCLDIQNKQAGTFAKLDSRTQSYSTSSRSYLGHTATGSSTISTDTSSYKIQWTAPSTNMGNVTFYVTWNKANGDANNTGDLIYAKTFTAGPSSLLPTCKVSIQDKYYCTGTQLTFDATTTGTILAYNWIFPGLNVNPNSSQAQNPKVTYSNTGTYKAILSVQSSKGWSTPDTLIFQVNSGPGAAIQPNTTQTICEGDSVLLSGNNVSNASYLWNPGGENTKTIYAKDSGSYTVTVTGSNGCSRTSSPVLVKINKNPVISAIKSFTGDTICQGSPFTVGALIVSGQADSFSFSSASGPYQDSNMSEFTLNSGSATYSIWGKSSQGCVSNAASVTIQSKSRIAGPVCSSSNLTYTGFRVNWNPVSGATGYKVSTDSGKSYITPSSGATGLYHDVTGLIGNQPVKVLVVALTNGICSESSTTEFIDTTLSCAPLDYTLSTTQNKLCRNSLAEIKIHNLSGKNIAVKVDGVFTNHDTIQEIKVTGTRDYTVSVLDSFALICGYTNKQILLIEDTIGTPSMDQGGNYDICSKNPSVSVIVTVTKGYNTDSLMYFKNSTLETKTKSFTHQYTTSDGDSLYTRATNKSGCLSDKSNVVKVRIFPFPSAAFTTNNTHFDYTFTANDTSGTHLWKINGDSSGGFSVQYDLTSYANDTITVEHQVNKNGCMSIETQRIFIPDFAGISGYRLSGFKVYPNPAKNTIRVVLSGEIPMNLFEIRNTTGQLVLSTSLSQKINEISVESLPPGVYYYKIQTSQKKTTGSLIIER